MFSFISSLQCRTFNLLGDLADMAGVSGYPMNSCVHQSLGSERQGLFFLKQDLHRQLDTILEYLLIYVDTCLAR